MKPKGFLRAGFLSAAVFFSLFFTIEASALASEGVFLSTDSAEGSVVAGDEQKIHRLINREREKNGLGELRWQNDLARLARAYSEKMARGNFFSHFEPGGAGVADRARVSGIKNWNRIGENLFYCMGMREYDRFAVQNWMRSEMHRKNILNRSFTATGIGLARSREGKIYVTQIFIEV